MYGVSQPWFECNHLEARGVDTLGNIMSCMNNACLFAKNNKMTV